MEFPRIVHLIYIPWDQRQKLKKDYMDFDQTFYYEFKEQVGNNWKVKLWTWDKIKIFTNKYCLDEWKLIKKYASRPTMLVDYLRWKIIYCYGGIYWQYGCVLKKPLEYLIPPKSKTITLLTESELILEFIV
jgi:mannosyltransferase OCH1-like enzyme